MDYFVEMFLMVVVSLLFSFLVAKLVTVAMAVNDLTENPEIVGVGNDFGKEEVDCGFKMDAEPVDFGCEANGFDVVVKEKLDCSLKMDAPVVESERYFEVVDQNVEPVDRFDGSANCEESVVQTAEAAVSPEMIVRGVDERSEEVTVPENEVGEEIVIQSRLENEESEQVVEEVKVEEEEDDDWEGIERSEVEKAFAAAVNYLDAEEIEIGPEAKMELYGLHKIATQGSCREAQPMGFMVSARAKWNAWHKLGDMSQEEAMEKYLALVSKEIPGLINSGTIQDPSTTLATPTCVASTKKVSGES